MKAHKRTEEELKSSYALLRMAGDIAKFGGWSVDLSRRICHWSDAVADIHEMPRGYSPSVNEGIGFYAPEWRDRITRVFAHCAEKGIRYDEEMEILTGKGKRVWVRTIGEAVRDDQGKIVKVQGAFQDISDRNVAEEALRRSEAFIRTILDNLPIGIAVNSVDPEVRFSYMNDEFPRIYRTARERLTEPNQFWEAVYEDPEFRTEIRRRVLEDCASGDPRRMCWTDIPLTRRGEETTIISARNIPIPDTPLMISTVLDITERKRAEAELLKMKADLENQVAEKTRQLQKRVSELQRFHDATIGREFRIKELKDEIERLKKERP